MVHDAALLSFAAALILGPPAFVVAALNRHFDRSGPRSARVVRNTATFLIAVQIWFLALRVTGELVNYWYDYSREIMLLAEI